MPTLDGGDYMILDVEGVQVMVSPEDYARVALVSWTIGRAGRILGRNEKPAITLQRFITGPPPYGYEVTLARPGYTDFRRSNLLWATRRATKILGSTKQVSYTPLLSHEGGVPKYIVHWMEGQERRRKSFSVKRYGMQEALFRAETFWNGYVKKLYEYIVAQETITPVY